MLEGGAPLYLFAIPVLWSLAGGSAAVFILRIPEDVSLLVAGVVGPCMLVWKLAKLSQRTAKHIEPEEHPVGGSCLVNGAGLASPSKSSCKEPDAGQISPVWQR